MAEKLELDMDAQPNAMPAQAPSQASTSAPYDWQEGYREQISDIAKQAQSDNPRALRRQMLEGSEDLSRMVGNQDFDRQIGTGNDTLLDAVRQKTMRQHGQNQRRFRSDVDIASYNKSAERLANASQLVSQEIALNKKAAAIREAKKRAKKAARGGVLGNVLGIAGAVVGGIAGGGVGASAGYAAGSSAGQMIGGS